MAESIFKKMFDFDIPQEESNSSTPNDSEVIELEPHLWFFTKALCSHGFQLDEAFKLISKNLHLTEEETDKILFQSSLSNNSKFTKDEYMDFVRDRLNN